MRLPVVLALATVVVAGGLIYLFVSNGESDETYPLGVALPSLGERPDLFQLPGQHLADGCEFEDSDRAEADIQVGFVCPDDPKFVSGQVALVVSSSAADLVLANPSNCRELGSGGFICSHHQGVVGLEADAQTLDKARRRLAALAGVVAALPPMPISSLQHNPREPIE